MNPTNEFIQFNFISFDDYRRAYEEYAANPPATIKNEDTYVAAYGGHVENIYGNQRLNGELNLPITCNPNATEAEIFQIYRAQILEEVDGYMDNFNI